MPELVIAMTMGDEDFRLKGITLKELMAVKSWTGIPNKPEWINGIHAGDPEALMAAYGIAVWRRTKAKPRVDDLDFDTDTLNTRLLDGATDREVDVAFETKADGSLKLDKENKPIVSRERDGATRFRYVDDGTPVPPTETASAT